MSRAFEKVVWAVGAACFFGHAFVSSRSAMAISTLEDTLRNPPRIFRTPSSEPPNNAVHRDFGVRPRIDELQKRDIGPGPEEHPVIIPAASAPWAVAISDGPELSRGFVCAGVLVAPQWVLTAAHCTYNLVRRWPNDDNAYVFVGVSKLSAPGRRFDVQEIVPHPEYNAKMLRNDVALLKIDAEGGSAGLPISLKGPPISEQVGAIGSILGWGITTVQQNRRHAERLHVIQTAVLDNRVCFSQADFPELSGTQVFCGRSLSAYHDICFRFGGSPMVFYDKKANLYLGGLVSWPAICDDTRGRPNVYLDVQAYVPWIEKTIASKAK
jgi:secreted trypsin-like serine protease